MVAIGVFLISTVFSIASAVSLDELSRAIESRWSKVQAYAEIERLASNNGLHVALYGGSAASFAAYVLWDLKREGGDPIYRADYFDYQLQHILRMGQDLDLVIWPKGREDDQNISAFEHQVKELLPSVQIDLHHRDQELTSSNGKVREPVNSRSFNLIHQNTDSMSTGLIELGNAFKISDLKTSADGVPLFLSSLISGVLRYIDQPNHRSTKRYLEGLNPEWISVFRALINASRFGLNIEEASAAKLVSYLSNSLKPSSQYEYQWLRSNQHKLFRQSFNLEKTFLLLNRLRIIGLLRDRFSVDHDFAKYLDRRPLSVSRARRLRSEKNIANPRTAAALGIKEITHETQDFAAFQAIYSSPTFWPQFLISDGQGESKAIYGAGVYARAGKWGRTSSHYGGGYHVRMELLPDAMEGTDFVISEPGLKPSLILLNLEKVKLIPIKESLEPRSLINLASRALKTGHIDQFKWMALQWKNIPITDMVEEEWMEAIFAALKKGKLAAVVAALESTQNKKLETLAHGLAQEFRKRNDFERQFKQFQKWIILHSKYRVFSEYSFLWILPVFTVLMTTFNLRFEMPFSLRAAGPVIGLIGLVSIMLDAMKGRLPRIAGCWIPILMKLAVRNERRSDEWKNLVRFMHFSRATKEEPSKSSKWPQCLKLVSDRRIFRK